MLKWVSLTESKKEQELTRKNRSSWIYGQKNYWAAATILKEDIADIIIIGTPEEVEENSKGLDIDLLIYLLKIGHQCCMNIQCVTVKR